MFFNDLSQNYNIFPLPMQLNSIMDMFAKEAVRKICSLFIYCSAVAPVETLSNQENLKKALSQMGRDVERTTYIYNTDLQSMQHTL